MSFIEDLKYLCATIGLVALFFSCAVFTVNRFEKNSCEMYMKETGIQTKHVDYDTCYMLDNDRFVSKEEFFIRQQAQNINIKEN